VPPGARDAHFDEHHGVQAIPGVVRQPDSVGFTVKRCDGDDGTEDLLMVDPHLLGGADQHRRPDPPAFVRTAGEELGSFGFGDLEVVAHLLPVFFACQWPDVGGGVGRVADHETLGQVDEAIDELVEDRALDIETAAGQADLAGVGEGSCVSGVRICGLFVALHAAAMTRAQRNWNQSN
jgi:hypothetical protein